MLILKCDKNHFKQITFCLNATSIFTRGGEMILGLEGAGVILAYICTILAALWCVVYGIVNWNKPAETEAQEIAEEMEWEKHDPEMVEARGLQ